MANRETQDICRRIPKVDLHIHLDGSLTEEFLVHSAASGGPELCAAPALLRQNLLRTKVESPEQAVGGNWRAFDICNDHLQNAVALREATMALLRTHHEQHNVWVVEVRFCPALHTKKGMNEEEVVEAVCEAVTRYGERRREKFRGGVILCALRSMGIQHTKSTLALAKRWCEKGSPVVGADVAGDEGAYPLKALKEVLNGAEVPLTVHAGEWMRGGVDNVRVALEVGARRIGHGIVVADDNELVRMVRKSDVGIETCLTSNCANPIKTGISSFKTHPVRRMLDAGVTITGFNCDNTLLSGTECYRPDPSAEVQRAVELCGLLWTQVRQVLVDGVRKSFVVTDSADDAEFIRRFEVELDNELAGIAD